MLDNVAIYFLSLITGIVATSEAVITPSSPAEILIYAQQQFTCTVQDQDNWSTIYFGDDVNGVVATFVNREGCKHFELANDFIDVYEISCGTSLGQFHYTIKSVTETFHNKNVKCTAQFGTGTAEAINSTVISVIMPLRKISIYPNVSTVDVERSKTKQFICHASSRPPASILWKKQKNGQIIGNLTNYEEQIDGKNVKSFLNYTGNKTDEGAKIFCIGKYNGTQKMSKNITLRVIYPPDTELSVHQTPAANITAGVNVKLTCEVSGGNPLPVLSWNCTGIFTNNTMGNKASYSVAFRVDKTYNNLICICNVLNYTIVSYSPSAQHVLTVIYPPDKEPVIQQVPTKGVFAGNDVTLTCTVSGGNPLATLAWDCIGTSINGTKGTTASYSVTFTVNKTHNNKICTCSATHFVTSYKHHVEHKLIVYYAPEKNPSIQRTPDKNLTVGDNVTLTCMVIGGNPLANLSWNCTGNKIDNTSGTIASKSVAFTVNKTYNNMVCTCAASHSVETYNNNVQYTLVVYFGPGLPVVTAHPTMPWFESNSTSLVCDYEEGNPKSSIRWTRGNKSVEAKNDNSVFEFDRLTRDEDTMQISCTVYNSYSERLSALIYLDVHYVPDIMVEKTFILTNEGKSISLSCTASGNPVPFVRWTMTKKNMNSQTANTSIVDIENINRTDSGNYTCVANSFSIKYGNLVSTDDTQVVVNFAPDVTVTKNVLNITENTDLTLTCNAAGKPPNYVYGWKHTYAGHVIRVFNSQTKALLLKSISYQDIGEYECFVNNGIEDRHGILNQANNTRVEVQFKPQFVLFDNVTTGKAGTNVSIFAEFISFPDIDKTVMWRNSNGNSVLDTISNTFMTLERKHVYTKIYNISVSFDNHGYTSSLNFPNFDEYQDGFYNLEVSNIIGENNLTMRLVFSDSPEPPTLFSASVIDSTAVTLTWTEGFNGGNNQTFVITYWNINTVHKKSVNVPERSDKNYEVEISDLIPSTSYVFHIIARNVEGSSDTGNNTIVLQTTDISETASSIIGPVAGAVGGIFSAGLFVVGIIILRRKKSASRQKTDRKNLTFASREGDDEDGLKDNELYVSAGENFTENSVPIGDVYAVIRKPNDKKVKETHIQETGLYAEVKKKKGEAKSEEVSTNARKKQTGNLMTKVKKRQENVRNDDVYENITEQNMKNTPKNRNKDGLVYADLVFKDDGKRKFIIRGIDNKTEYADIDLDLKADPLPSDESDEENEKVKENFDSNNEK